MMSVWQPFPSFSLVPPLASQPSIQNGGDPGSTEELDTDKRYIRNARDLARLVATDTIYT